MQLFLEGPVVSVGAIFELTNPMLGNILNSEGSTHTVHSLLGNDLAVFYLGSSGTAPTAVLGTTA